MRFVIIGASIACAALIGLAIFLSTQSSTQKVRIIALHPSAEQREKVGGWVRGAEKPTVTLVEYADLQCPGCAAMSPIIEQALASTDSFVQYQYRHYLIPGHNKARFAAQAAEAAGRQGKFKEMTDYLFSTQTTWVQDTTFAFKDYVYKYAQSLNLNMDQFKADQNDSAVNDLINKNVTEANAIPISGTPTIIINGNKLNFLPKTAALMVKLLEAAKVSQDELVKTINEVGKDEVSGPASTLVPSPTPAAAN